MTGEEIIQLMLLHGLRKTTEITNIEEQRLKAIWNAHNPGITLREAKREYFELEISKLLNQGLKDEEICERLSLPLSTLRNRMSRSGIKRAKTRRQIMIESWLRENEYSSASEISEGIGLPQKSIEAALRLMLVEGYIWVERDLDQVRGRPRNLYSLNEASNKIAG